ncbi:hypothetical protein GF407_02525 [candidate division KSB1 bacterium]|nr:hypothetical protein [candidate division KSB1 bacterium]
MVPYILFGITYAFAAAVQPGPLQTFLISQTLRRGWKRTLPAALAPLLSDGPIIVVVLLLLSRIGDGFFQFLHIGGGLFLLYLACSSLNSWRHFELNRLDEEESGQKTWLSAAVVNFLNPNPYIGWSLVMGPIFLKGWQETPLHGISMIVAFYITMVVSLAAIIFVFAFARELGPRINRISLGLSSLALALFGIYQLGLGFKIV